MDRFFREELSPFVQKLRSQLLGTFAYDSNRFTMSNEKEGWKMAKDEPKSRKQGRDDDTGRFKSVEQARRDKNNSSVEHIPLPGHGTEYRKRKK